MPSKVRNKLLRVLQSPSPYHIKRINYAVTLVCNAFCRMCGIWRNDKGKNVYPYEDELAIADLRAAFEGNALLDSLDDVSITGGEPFLRKDLDEICLFFLQQFPNTYLTINSNFYLEAAMIPFLERLKGEGELERLTLCFSVDGLQPTHDRIRGVPNGFESILQCVKNIQSQFGTRLVLSFTVLPQNYKELEDVYQFSRDLNTGFTFRFADISEIYYGNVGTKFEWQEDQLTFLEGKVREIVTSMAKERPFLRRFWSADLYFFSQLVNYRRNPRRIFTCCSGTHSLYLDSFGNVYPCIMLGSKMGNIKEKHFSEIWFSDCFREVRQDINDEKCHCWTECEAIPSLQRKLVHST